MQALTKEREHERDIEEEVLELLGGHEGDTLDALIRAGIPLSVLDKLAQRGIDAGRLGIINPRTLRHRRQKSEPLNSDEGDRLYRVSRIVVLAEDVFGSQEKAATWLNKPRRALGGRNAFEAVKTTPGYLAVEELLEQLRHGYVA